MKKSLENKLYKNLIITVLLIIISIAISIAMLASITTELTILKNENKNISLNIYEIAIAQNFKQSYLKDIFFSYGNLKKFRYYLKLYNKEKEIQNNIMQIVEKNIIKSRNQNKIADLYVELYNYIIDHQKKENEIIIDLKNSDISKARKNFTLLYKNNDNKFDTLIEKFYNFSKIQSNTIKTLTKGKITIILIINAITFFIFIFTMVKVLSYISKNLNYLHRSVNNIKNGNLETSIYLDSEDELGELALALDRMRQSYYKSIKRLNKWRKQ